MISHCHSVVELKIKIRISAVQKRNRMEADSCAVYYCQKTQSDRWLHVCICVLKGLSSLRPFYSLSILPPLLPLPPSFFLPVLPSFPSPLPPPANDMVTESISEQNELKKLQKYLLHLLFIKVWLLLLFWSIKNHKHLYVWWTRF